MSALNANEDIGKSPHRYELIDKDGKVVSEYLSAEAAAKVASWMFPDQEQDPDRTGKGWDIQVVEAK